MDTKPCGLTWQESIEGVLLPVVAFVDDIAGPGINGMLNDLLDGYKLMASTYQLVQSEAYDAEEQVDWALDWESQDWENARCGNIYNPELATAQSDLPAAFALGVSRRGPDWDGISSSGKAGEARWQNENPGSSSMRRMLDGNDKDGAFKRSPDFEEIGPDGQPTGVYCEVKHGYQGATARTKRQMQRNRALMDSPDSGVTKVKWVFYYDKSKKRSGPSSTLLQELAD